MVLLLGTCSSLLGTGSSLLGTCPTLLGTSPSLSHTTSLSSSPSFTIRHPFIIRYWLNFLGHASFISTFLKYLREEHCVASWVILARETPLQLETRQSQYQGLYSSLLGVVMIQGVESFITGKNISPVLDYNSKLLKNAQRCFYPPFMSSLTVASAPSPASFCGTHLYSP